MADVIDADKFYPTFGSAWSATIADFATNVVDDNNTDWGYDVLSSRDGCRAWYVKFTNGGDVHFRYYKPMDTVEGQTTMWWHLAQQPGSRAQTPILPLTVGDTQSREIWNDVIRPLRHDIIEEIGDCFQETTATVDENLNLTGMRARIVNVVYTRLMYLFVDTLICYTDDGSGSYSFAGNIPPTDGQFSAGAPTILAGGGGGSVDLAPVVAALQDIALMDVDYVANNGSTTWSMRGRVRSE
jgi:hypothetical protein